MMNTENADSCKINFILAFMVLKFKGEKVH